MKFITLMKILEFQFKAFLTIIFKVMLESSPVCNFPIYWSMFVTHLNFFFIRWKYFNQDEKWGKKSSLNFEEFKIKCLNSFFQIS